VTITGFTTADVPDGITVDTPTFDATTTTLRVSGGMRGKLYRITHRATFSDGQRLDRVHIERVV
jgi:hypothetical protein